MTTSMHCLNLLRIIGVFYSFYFIAITYSLFKIYSRKYAFIIANDFFIDNSRYESFGKIQWININEVRTIKKNLIQFKLSKDVTGNNNLNLFQKFLSFMNNWNYKDDIIISTTFTQINRDELLDEILKKLQNQKNYG